MVLSGARANIFKSKWLASNSMDDDPSAETDVDADGAEMVFCDICGNAIEACSCVCPYCGEREGCSCCLFDATTGGG